MKIHLIGGFLGSGKTTAIRHACGVLVKQGIKAGVVTNDQGVRLVDGSFFESLHIPARQVTGGCFCCHYNDLDGNIQSLIETDESEVIFAESVGSCTDIVATVMKPLLRFRPDLQITVSIFADACLLHMLLKENPSFFDENIRYIYFKQLEEAGILIINKIDLISDERLKELKDILRKKYAGKIMLCQNSLDGDSVEQWLRLLDNDRSAGGLPSLRIDYDIYGAGEARLAWLDEEIEIYSHTNKAVQAAVDLIQIIHHAIRQKDYPIGHLKFLLNGETKISFTSTSRFEIPVAAKEEKAFSVALLINARVEADPEKLSQLVADSIRKAAIRTGCSITVNSLSAFQPGYPRPTYRIQD